MTLFWIVAAVMLAAALALLLPALLHRRTPASGAADARAANLRVLREQLVQLDAELAAGALGAEAHRVARAEIERRALDEDGRDAGGGTATTSTRSPRTALAIGLALPLLALSLYGLLGNREALRAAGAPGDSAGVTPQQVAEMVDQLAAKMPSHAGQPDELEGWVLLARSYAALQRYADAGRAYERATALAPQDAQLLADRADVLAMLPDQRASSAQLVERALQLDPKLPKALALAGGIAFEARDFAAAERYWKRARAQAPADSEFARNLDLSIAEAQRAAGGSNAPAAAAPPASATAAASAAPGAEIRGTLRIAPALAAKLAPDDTVFVFARAVDGPRMPLAIARFRAAELPLAFTLDDASAMSPALQLSRYPRVIVGARVSKSGSATPSSGDLIAQSEPLAPGAHGLELVIDRVQP